MRDDLLELGGMVLLIIITMAIGFDLGARSCVQPSALTELDMMLGLLWRLLPLIAACGLLMYVGGLLWLDYVRRSWAAHHETMRDPLP